MTQLAPLTATGIGSAPFSDPKETVALILEHLPEAPFWPQLPRLGYLEDMVPQAARGLPGLKVDAAERTVQVDPAIPRDEALAQFYEAVLGEDLTPFALNPQEARGFFALLEAAAGRPEGLTALKGQVCGPVTFCGMVKDASGKPILYDRELTQAATQGLSRMAAWQAQKFRELGKEAVVFFDEPILTGFGSAYLPISREEVAEILLHTLTAARDAGPVTLGVHCCGNTDWSLIMDAPIDILSFDSFGYGENLLLYEKSLQAFLSRGGRLAWGLVPTGEELTRESSDSLWEKFHGLVQQVASQGVEVRKVLTQSLLTPACGLGYLTPENAVRALQLLGELSRRGREWLAAC